jgi:hypothetical protein
MSRIFAWLLAAYRITLWLYPAEFRSLYGGEMAQAFEQELGSEFASRGMRGVVTPVGIALRELITIALPGRLLRERMIPPALSLVMTMAILGCLEAWLHHKFLPCDHFHR